MLPVVLIVGGLGFWFLSRGKKNGQTAFPAGVDPTAWAAMQLEMGRGALAQGDVQTASEVAQILLHNGFEMEGIALQNDIATALGLGQAA
jgi:hypothetical protein